MNLDESDQPRIVRTAQDLQRAHDILVSALFLDPKLRAKILGDDDMNIRAATAAADVLCWALGHAHNKTFEENLEAVEESMEALGLELRDAGRLLPGSTRP